MSRECGPSKSRDFSDDTSPIIRPSRKLKSGFLIGSGLTPTSHELARRLLVQRAVWPIFVVVLAPVFDSSPSSARFVSHTQDVYSHRVLR